MAFSGTTPMHLQYHTPEKVKISKYFRTLFRLPKVRFEPFWIHIFIFLQSQLTAVQNVKQVNEAGGFETAIAPKIGIEFPHLGRAVSNFPTKRDQYRISPLREDGIEFPHLYKSVSNFPTYKNRYRISPPRKIGIEFPHQEKSVSNFPTKRDRYRISPLRENGIEFPH